MRNAEFMIWIIIDARIVCLNKTTKPLQASDIICVYFSCSFGILSITCWLFPLGQREMLAAHDTKNKYMNQENWSSNFQIVWLMNYGLCWNVSETDLMKEMLSFLQIVEPDWGQTKKEIRRVFLSNYRLCTTNRFSSWNEMKWNEMR